MFSFKIIFSRLLFPVTLIQEILILGLLLLWFTRRKRAGKIVVTLGTVFLVLLSNCAISDFLLFPLENKYPALMDPKDDGFGNEKNCKSGKMIVMLGGGHISDPRIPITGYLLEPAFTRLLEAVRLYKELPGSKLILSGGKGRDAVPEAEVLKKVVFVMGVKPQDVILESESIDTEDQARRLKTILGKEKFILVTSASHIPRAMALFKKQGLNPIAAPAGHLTKGGIAHDWWFSFPNSWHLYKAERAFYEYLGLAWAYLSMKI